MKGVLIGADLMYRQDGKLVPIEINTNVAWDRYNRQEYVDSVTTAEYLVRYAQDHGITDIYLEGPVAIVGIKAWPVNCPIRCYRVQDIAELEQIEDAPTKLIVRSAYSDEAYVDNFCRDKINFLKAIKGRDFGCEYLLKTEEGLEGEITFLYDNGNYPNIVVKYRYPQYDRAVYPKVLRFSNLEDLRAYAETELEEDYFMMPFYYNEEKGIYYEEQPGHESHKRIQFLRNWSIFAANEGGTIDSIQVGSYTKFTGIVDESKLVWNEDGTPEDPTALRAMLFQDKWVHRNLQDLLLDEDDLVLMEDGSWKSIQNIEQGDVVKSIELPHTEDVNLRDKTADYNVSLEEVESNSRWVSNQVLDKEAVETWMDFVQVVFTDGTDWYDTAHSAYPSLDSEDGTVRFVELENLGVGSKILLMPFDGQSLENPTFVVKEIAEISAGRKLQRGYSLGLNGSHLFLSRTSEDETSYISIEHNDDCPQGCFWDEGSCEEKCGLEQWGPWDCFSSGGSCSNATTEGTCYSQYAGECHKQNYS